MIQGDTAHTGLILEIKPKVLTVRMFVHFLFYASYEVNYICSSFGIGLYLEFNKLAVGSIYTTNTTSSPHWFTFCSHQNIMYLIFAAGTTSDLSISIALCVLLFQARTGFRKYITLSFKSLASI